jgi:hypothetical protein
VEEKTYDKIMILRPEGISDEDLKRLTAFVRIGSEALRHHWQISPDGHFDALMLGDEETLPMNGLLGESVGTLRLVESRSYEGEPGQLCRPLAFEALIAQLMWLEDRPVPAPRAAPVAPMVQAEVAADVLTEAVEIAPETPAGAGDEPQVGERGVSHSLCHGDLYRLERLPSASSVGHDRRVLTVASLLTLRAVHLDELVAKSGLTVSDCEAALIRLKALGSLHVIAPIPIEAARERLRGRVERVARETEAPAGVIARLRGRLGLGGR